MTDKKNLLLNGVRSTSAGLLSIWFVVSSAVFLTACVSNPVQQTSSQAVPSAPTDQRELVSSVQRMLSQKGFDPGPIDGVEGRATRTALSQFQNSRGLPSTGQVNDEAYQQLVADGRGSMQPSSYSSASQQMRNDSKFVNQSYLEACGVGAVAGGIIGYLVDKKAKGALVGAGAGCVVAMGANYWLQGQRKQAAYKEEEMQQMLTTLQDENRKLSSLVNSSKAVVAEDRRKIEQIDAAYRKKQISLEEAKKQMAEVDDNQQHLEKTLANLEERKNNWKQLGSKLRQSQPGSQSAAVDAEIASLEKKIAVLKTELSSLEQTRRVSSIG